MTNDENNEQENNEQENSEQESSEQGSNEQEKSIQGKIVNKDFGLMEACFGNATSIDDVKPLRLSNFRKRLP
ncbi:MAG: hypothetical protein ACYDEF_01665 [Methanosarcina sp.]